MDDKNNVYKIEKDFLINLKMGDIRKADFLDVVYDDSCVKEMDIKDVLSIDKNIISSIEYKESLKLKKTIIENFKHNRIFSVLSDTKLSINGSGQLYIVVEKDVNIFLDFDMSSLLAGLVVNIIVKNKSICNIFEINTGDNFYKLSYIFCDDNCVVNHYIVNSDVKSSNICTIIKESGTYYTDIINLNKNVSHKGFTYLYNLQQNSVSELLLIAIAENGFSIDCSGLVRISKDAKNASGKQNLKGFLIDDESLILLKPDLEVLNNDVACSHKAEVFDFSYMQKYYMESRGIFEGDIYDMIILGKALFFLNKAFTYCFISDFNKCLEKSLHLKISS